MTNTKRDNNAFRIASKIFENADLIINNDSRAKLHAELENVIKTLDEIENINVNESVEYFDFEIILNKVRAENSSNELIAIVEIATKEQFHKWFAQLANLVDTHFDKTIDKLETLYSEGLKVNKIKSHEEFIYLGGYLGRVSEETGGQH